ncbi:hypothetical protein CLI74_10205 [Porphyromonas gingivalis]|nr:hypothetical protein CLI74_10205 [Porphyromonas gingivalis]
MYFVAVSPSPELPKITNILIVDLTIPNWPKASFPKIRADKIPPRRTKNLDSADPKKDQTTPDINFRPRDVDLYWLIKTKIRFIKNGPTQKEREDKDDLYYSYLTINKLKILKTKSIHFTF